MPSKPLWLDRLSQVIEQLEQRAEPWVDRATLESLLGVGRRRAQQLLAQVPGQTIGASSVVRRDDLIDHLRHVAAGQDAYYERRRLKQLWSRLDKPPVLVAVPSSEVRRLQSHDFAALPEGVELAPGSITVRFQDAGEALRKLMALAIAVGQNRAAFEERVALPKTAAAGESKLYDL